MGLLTRWCRDSFSSLLQQLPNSLRCLYNNSNLLASSSTNSFNPTTRLDDSLPSNRVSQIPHRGKGAVPTYQAQCLIAPRTLRITEAHNKCYSSAPQTQRTLWILPDCWASSFKSVTNSPCSHIRMLSNWREEGAWFRIWLIVVNKASYMRKAKSSPWEHRVSAEAGASASRLHKLKTRTSQLAGWTITMSSWRNTKVPSAW